MEPLEISSKGKKHLEFPSFFSFLTLLLKEQLQAEAILWRSCSQITCHSYRKIFKFKFYKLHLCCSWEYSRSHFRGWETGDSFQALCWTAPSFQCTETCMHTKFSLCTDAAFFTALAWTFCTQKGGAFAETAPRWTCSNPALPFKAWPHQIPQHRSPTCSQGRRERQAGHLLATRMLD